MASLLELIRSSAAPPHLRRSAAQGKLNIPPAEQLEVLVHLADDAELGAQARATLAGWPEQDLAALCAAPQLPVRVAEFFLGGGAQPRTQIITALASNRSVPESLLVKFAADAPAEFFPCLLSAGRARAGRALLLALGSNASGAAREQVEQALRELGPEPGEANAAPSLAEDVQAAEPGSDFERENAEEIASQQQRPFELTLGSPDEKDELAELLPLVKPGGQSAAPDKKAIGPEKGQQLSTLQKIAALTVPERVQLAMRGSREERMILIRDGVKVVALAVLESPKLSETEMESFAGMKNVQEIVLRGIAIRRRFMKVYGVVRALVNNPRTPLDVSLPLLKTLLLMDLKNLMRNKSIPELVTRVAAKVYLDKSQTHNR
jgi:hypothetical protein